MFCAQSSRRFWPILQPIKARTAAGLQPHQAAGSKAQSQSLSVTGVVNKNALRRKDGLKARRTEGGADGREDGGREVGRRTEGQCKTGALVYCRKTIFGENKIEIAGSVFCFGRKRFPRSPISMLGEPPPTDCPREDKSLEKRNPPCGSTQH